MKTRLPLSLASWLLAITLTSVTVANASPSTPLSGNIEINGIYDNTFIYNNTSDDPGVVTLTGNVTINNTDRQERLFTSSGKLTITGPGQSLSMNDNSSMQTTGGAIYADSIIINGLNNIVMNGNTSIASPDDENYVSGGAISGSTHVRISGTTGDIVFQGNTLNGQITNGGAISSGYYVESLPVPSSLFSGLPDEDSYLAVVLKGNHGNISFIGNVIETPEGDYTPWEARAMGGAISSDGTVEISGTEGKTLFQGNLINGLCHGYGGAIEAYYAIITNNNGLEFSGNVVTLRLSDGDGEVRGFGGAISTSSDLNIDHNRNGIIFTNNKVVVTEDASNGNDDGDLYGDIKGGAISSEDGSVTLAYNRGDILFADNATIQSISNGGYGDVSSMGGAIYAAGDVKLTGNYDSITFKNNLAQGDLAKGGAIAGEGRSNGGGGGDAPSSVSLLARYVPPTILGNVTLSGNMREILFENNWADGISTALGGAIYSGKSVELLNNEGSIRFINNHAQAFSAGGGAIAGGESGGGGVPQAENLLATYASSTDGTVTLRGNMGEILFGNNRAEGLRSALGGAIYSEGTVELMSNESAVRFVNNHVKSANYSVPSSLDNQKATGGGAIYSENHLTISGNKGLVLFEGNTATSKGDSFIAGGAIFSEGGVTIAGNEGDVVFLGNKAIGNNSGTRTVGGAIAAAGDVILRADKSDITFQGNRMGSKSNAIVMLGSKNGNPNGCVLDISATEGHQVVFYDGISFLPPSFSIKLNQGGEAGTILFSGAGAVVEQGTDRYGNYTSSSKIDSTLGGGQLVIADGALYGGGMNPGIFRVTGNASIRLDGQFSELHTEDLTYSGKGTLDMAGGTVTADNAIAMHRAQVLNSKGGRLNAPAITLHGGIIHDVKSPTHFIVNAEFSFAVSGNLNMRDHGLDVYRTVRFAQPFEIHVLTTEGVVKEGNLDSILSETTNSNRVGDETSNQGHWEMEWRNGDKDLYALWILEKAMEGPMDVVTPEEQGHLIPNSVWSTASNMNSMKESGYGQINLPRFTMQHDNNYWINGIGDFAIHNSVGKIDGYEYNGGGYAVGTDRKWTKNFVGGLAFGQIFGTNKSRNYNASIDQKTISGMIYGAWMKELNQKNNLLVQGSAAYGVTDNTLKTNYSDGSASRGSWDNEAWLLALKGAWNHSLENNWTVSPFVGVEYEDITQKAFTEGGDKARHFGKTALRNLSLPVGVGITKQHDFTNGMKWFNTLEISYLPDVYRENPKSDVARIDTSDAWTARGISNARNAVRVELYSRLFINDTWSTYAGYTMEGRDHSTFHRVNLGASATF